MFLLDAVEVCNNIPSELTKLGSTIITIIQIGVPIILIIFGMVDLFKAVISQKEEDIKKNQQLFLKRLLTAAIVFFIVLVTQMLITIVSGIAGDTSNSVWKCAHCFVDPDGANCPQ